MEKVSEKFAYPSKFIDVYGAKMHYVESGSGDPILFLHGIPTSSYVWRNIIPHLSTLGTCIAPDLIGFGRSDKPNIAYSLEDHIRYMDKFIETLGLKNITLVMHGWGSVIGFDYAMRHENNIKGLVFYEAFLRAIDAESLSLPYQEQLIAPLDEDDVLDVVTQGALFIDKHIPQSSMRELTETEMDYYRKPFLAEGAGKPIMQYLKELPRGDGKSEADNIINRYSKKLTKSKIPKLMLYSIPGFYTTIATAMWAKENLPNLEVSDMGEELHLAQESCPGLIGETISVWLQGVEA